MKDEGQFTTPYLLRLDDHARYELHMRREAWNISVADFYPKIDAWFSNFEREDDQALALKLLLTLQYYSEPDFKRAIGNRLAPIDRYLFSTGSTRQDLRLVLPQLRGDSADVHAYEIIKDWGLHQDQVITVDKLSAADSGWILLFFNDTHGTGNQFLREVFSQVRKEDFKAVFVVAMTIAERARLRFEREMEGIRVLPRVATPSIFDQLTAREVKRLRELGTQVYPKHPLGYGDAGLLVSYHFQCPNNTLPLIWADGENNAVDGKAFPWNPLFPYRPKKKAVKTPPIIPSPPSAPDASILDCHWSWSPEERQKIEDRIGQWGLTSSNFYRTVSKWFRNFKLEEREVALELFFATRYLDIAGVRKIIRDLRDDLMTELGRVGGDIADIILVTTGDEKNSVYHYMYEFIREWHLDVDQVCSLDRLSPDQVIDKTLVFFYHTRANGQHFEHHHSARLTALIPRCAVFAAYAMSSEAKVRFEKRKAPNRVMYSEENSRTMDQLGPDTLQVIAKIERELRPGLEPSEPRTTFLTAYYFQCPEASSALLWLDQDGTGGLRPWTPLFHRITLPSKDFG